jgi:hypothetical protein
MPLATLTQLAFLVRRRLLDGADAQVETSTFHGSSPSARHGRNAIICSVRRIIYFTHTNELLEMAGLIDVLRLNFIGVLPYTCTAGGKPYSRNWRDGGGRMVRF